MSLYPNDVLCVVIDAEVGGEPVDLGREGVLPVVQYLLRALEFHRDDRVVVVFWAGAGIPGKKGPKIIFDKNDCQ